VLDALSKADAPSARLHVEQEPEGCYNPFHLLCADGRETYRLLLRPDGLAVQTLDPGIHVLTNQDPEEIEAAKPRRIRDALRAIDLQGPLERVLNGLRRVLAIHGPEGRSLEGVCVHMGAYGTRSSGLFALGGRKWGFWHADGPPCETKYRNYSRLLDGLRQG
jgi:hypothetical protein